MPAHPRLFAFIVVGLLSACGAVSVEQDPGDDTVGKNDTNIDAGVPEIKGLGQTCDFAKNNTDCPASAPYCVGFAGTRTYCSPNCLENATGIGTATGGFNSITPAQSNAACIAAFTGTVGVPQCFAVYSWTPNDNPIISGKMYTDLKMSCVIACDDNSACPAPLEPITVGQRCVCLQR
ncbi:MAG: hypothetical protein AB7P03_21265 [Kofleriaceae bacterium]